MQNMLKSLGNIVGPDVPSPSNMWMFTMLYDAVFESDLYQWVPIESKSLEDENISFTPVDKTSTTIKTRWYDSMRELFLEWTDIFALKLQNDEHFIIIAKWDDIKKANKYSVRVMSSEVNG